MFLVIVPYVQRASENRITPCKKDLATLFNIISLFHTYFIVIHINHIMPNYTQETYHDFVTILQSLSVRLDTD
jgi:hypothetical protein